MLKPDTLALAGLLTTRSGRPLGVMIETGGPGLPGRESVAALRVLLLQIGQGIARLVEDDVTIEVRRLAIGHDGATLDEPANALTLAR